MEAKEFASKQWRESYGFVYVGAMAHELWRSFNAPVGVDDVVTGFSGWKSSSRLH